MDKKKQIKKYMKMAAAAGVFMQVATSVMDHPEEYKMLVTKVIPQMIRNKNSKV